VASILTRFARFTTFKINPVYSRQSCRRIGWSYSHWENKFIRLFIVIFTRVIPLWWRYTRSVVDIPHSRILHFPFCALWFNFYENYLGLTDIEWYFTTDLSPPVVSIWRYNKLYVLKSKNTTKKCREVIKTNEMQHEVLQVQVASLNFDKILEDTTCYNSHVFKHE
jgi:hypothetical protein